MKQGKIVKKGRSKKDGLHQVMSNAGKWTDLLYSVIVNSVRVNAVIPQALLIKTHGLIPAEAVSMLRNPGIENRLELLARWGIQVWLQSANNINVDIDYAQAA